MKLLAKSTILALLLTLCACGGSGQMNRLPQNTPPPPVHVPPPPVNAPFNPYFNATMIGKTATFYTEDGACQTFDTLKALPPNNYYAPETIDDLIEKQSGPAGTPCYWLGGIQNAGIHFNLSPDAQGRWYSPGWTQFYDGLINACPSPCTQEITQTAGTAGRPYMIVPRPDLPDTQTETIGPTAYDQYNAPGVLTFDNIINPLSFHAGNQLWSTTFFTAPDDIGDTWGTHPVLWRAEADPTDHFLKCSDQREAACGHERWCYKKNVGLVRREMLNDGGPAGNVCTGLNLPTIVRTSL